MDSHAGAVKSAATFGAFGCNQDTNLRISKQPTEQAIRLADSTPQSRTFIEFRRMSQDIGDIRTNLEYVRDMLEQLKIVSGAERGAMLFYLLDMAKLETEARIAQIDKADDGTGLGSPA